MVESNRTNDFQEKIATVSSGGNPLIVKILSGNTDSEIINLNGCNLIRFELPAVFTGTIISFKASCDDGITYTDLYRTGDDTLIVTPVTAGRQYVMVPQDLAGVQKLIIKSNASESAERIIKLVARTLS